MWSWCLFTTQPICTRQIFSFQISEFLTEQAENSPATPCGHGFAPYKIASRWHYSLQLGGEGPRGANGNLLLMPGVRGRGRTLAPAQTMSEELIFSRTLKLNGCQPSAGLKSALCVCLAQLFKHITDSRFLWAPALADHRSSGGTKNKLPRGLHVQCCANFHALRTNGTTDKWHYGPHCASLR